MDGRTNGSFPCLMVDFAGCFSSFSFFLCVKYRKWVKLIIIINSSVFNTRLLNLTRTLALIRQGVV